MTRIISGDRPAEIVIGSLLQIHIAMCVQYTSNTRGRTGAVSMADFRRGPRSRNLRDNGPFGPRETNGARVMARAGRKKKGERKIEAKRKLPCDA